MKSKHRVTYAGVGLENHPHFQMVAAGATTVLQKLHAIDPFAMDISEYNQHYFYRKKQFLEQSMHIYSYLLLAIKPMPIEETVFVDFGGGIGAMSALAKTMPFHKIVYVDIFDVSTRDAIQFGKVTNLSADAYLTGDIECLTAYLKEDKDVRGKPVMMCSFDVLEHIYDLKAFFTELKKVEAAVHFTMGSSANKYNPWIARARRKLQREVEEQDRALVPGHKERDSLESYLSIRQRIIREFLQKNRSTLSEGEVELLASKTRGLIKGDIEGCVQAYLRKGMFPRGMTDPTNTCDPITGNGCENLIDLKELENMLRELNITSSMLPGYFDACGDAWKIPLKSVLNRVAKIFPGPSLFYAPYYVLSGIANGP